MDKHKYLSELFEVMQNKLPEEDFCNWLAFCYGVLSTDVTKSQVEVIEENLDRLEGE